MTSYRPILSLLIATLCSLPSAFAAEPELLRQGETLRATPGGKEIAELQRETRGAMLQRQGEWVRLQVDGYIWRSSTEPLPEPAASQALPASLPIQLLDYRIKWRAQDFQRSDATGRAHITASFHFRNNLPASLACVEYQVRFYNLAGRLLHQQRVGCAEGLLERRGEELWHSLEWREYSGAPGEVYRQMAEAAEADALRIDLTLDRAWYDDGSLVNLDQPSP